MNPDRTGAKHGRPSSPLPPLFGPPMPDGHYERALLFDFLSWRLYAIFLYIIETLESMKSTYTLGRFMHDIDHEQHRDDTRYHCTINRSHLPPPLRTLFEGLTVNSGVQLFHKLVPNTIVKNGQPDSAYCFYMTLDYIFLEYVRHSETADFRILRGGAFLYVVFQAMKLVGARVADRVRYSPSDVVRCFQHVVVQVTHPYMNTTLKYLVDKERIELGPGKRSFEALVRKGNTGSHDKPLVSFELINKVEGPPEIEFRIHPRPDVYTDDEKKGPLRSTEDKINGSSIVQTVSMVHDIFRPADPVPHPYVLEYKQNEDPPAARGRPVWTNMITFKLDRDSVQDEHDPSKKRYPDNDYFYEYFSQETNHQDKVICENSRYGIHAFTGGAIHQMLRAYIRNITTDLLVKVFQDMSKNVHTLPYQGQLLYRSVHKYTETHLGIEALFSKFQCTVTLKDIKDIQQDEYPFQKYSAGWNSVGFSSAQKFNPLRIVAKWRIQPMLVLDAIQSDLINQMVVSGMITPNPITTEDQARAPGIEPIYRISVNVRQNNFNWSPDMTGPFGEIRERSGPAMLS